MENMECSEELKEKLSEVMEMAKGEGVDITELVASMSQPEAEVSDEGEEEEPEDAIDRAKKRKIVVMALKKSMGSEEV